MNHEEAIRIVENLQQAVISMKPDQVRQAFSALVYLDEYRIRQRAEQILAQTDLTAVKAMRLAGDDPQHRLTAEVFSESMQEYLQNKPADVDPSVEYDIPTWIEGSAVAIVSANLRIMEAALPHEVPHQAHRTLIEFHRHIDFAKYEDEQHAALQRAWSAIEARIEAFLANAQDA